MTSGRRVPHVADSAPPAGSPKRTDRYPGSGSPAVNVVCASAASPRRCGRTIDTTCPRARRPSVSRAMVSATPLISGGYVCVTIELCGVIIRHRAHLCPREHELEVAVDVLDDRGAVLHPVATVGVDGPVDPAQSRAVNVSAHHAGETAAPGLVGERALEGRHEIDDGLQAILEIAGQAPVPEPEASATSVEPPVEGQPRVASDTAEPHDPAMTARDAVEIVAVQDQQQAAVGGAMDRLPRDHDVAELQIAEPPQVLVVVAGDQADNRARARLRQDLPDDVAVRLRPVRLAPQAPEIDDVADQVEVVAVVAFEKRQESPGFALPSAEMNVADPDGAIAHVTLIVVTYAPGSRVKSLLPICVVCATGGARDDVVRLRPRPPRRSRAAPGCACGARSHVPSSSRSPAAIR